MMMTSNIRASSNPSMSSNENIDCEIESRGYNYYDCHVDLQPRAEAASTSPSPKAIIDKATNLVDTWKLGSPPTKSASPARSSSIRTETTVHTFSLDSSSSSAEFKTGKRCSANGENDEAPSVRVHSAENTSKLNQQQYSDTMKSVEYNPDTGTIAPPGSAITAAPRIKKETKRSLVNMLAQAMVNAVLEEDEDEAEAEGTINELGRTPNGPISSNLEPSGTGNSRSSSEPILPGKAQTAHAHPEQTLHRLRSKDLPPRTPSHRGYDEPRSPPPTDSVIVETRRRGRTGAIVGATSSFTSNSTTGTTTSSAGTRSSASSGGTSGSSRNSATVKTIEQVQAYVLSQLPPTLKDQLSPETWKDVIESAVQAHWEEQAAKHGTSLRSRSTTTASSCNEDSNCKQTISSSDDDATLSRNDFRITPGNDDQAEAKHDDDEDEDYAARSVVSDITFPTLVSQLSDDRTPKTSMKRPSGHQSLVEARAEVIMATDGTNDLPMSPLTSPSPSMTPALSSNTPVVASFPASSLNRDAPPRIPGRSWRDGTTTREVRPPSMPTRFASGTSRASSAPSHHSPWKEAEDLMHHAREEQKRKLEEENNLSLSSTSVHGTKYFSHAKKQNSPSKKKKLPKRSVSFDSVQVRQYERVLEVNPCTSSGPSVGLGWNYIRESPKKVDRFEYDRTFGKEEDEVGDFDGHKCPSSSFKKERRRDTAPHRVYGGPMPLPRHVREALVRDWGYSQKEIARAIRHTIKARNQRRQTVNNLSSQKMEEMMETSKKKVRQLLTFGGVGSSNKIKRSKKDKKKKKRRDARSKKDRRHQQQLWQEDESQESSHELKDPLEMDSRKVALLDSRWK